jgi:hypothetical protein
MDKYYDEITAALAESVERAKKAGEAKCGVEGRSAYALGYLEQCVRSWIWTLPDRQQRHMLEQICRTVAIQSENAK